MGYQSVVYGRIQCVGEPGGWRDQPWRGRLIHHNQCVIQGLPDSDEAWPYLTRHLLAMASLRLGWNVDRGVYRERIVHFGGSLAVPFRDGGYAEQWLLKFESLLLDTLVWRSAVVHFEDETLGCCQLRYTANQSSIAAVLEEFELVGERVEARLDYIREPPPGNDLGWRV